MSGVTHLHKEWFEVFPGWSGEERKPAWFLALCEPGGFSIVSDRATEAEARADADGEGLPVFTVGCPTAEAA